MRCHYEVLDVPRDIESEGLKKSYRKLALKWHPDKNIENVEEATSQFRLIQQAYDVLSDPHERAWYDKHREAILRGGLGSGDYNDQSLNVFQYFSASCYSGFDDSDNGFYSIYRDVFKTISVEDKDFFDGNDSDFDIPEFGHSNSIYEETVHIFYAYWMSYCTMKSYVWVDKYDIREAPNRRVSRLMEKENKKLRDQAKKKRNEEVRALVAFVRKRDKRVIAHRKLLEKKAADNCKKMEEMKRKQLEERKKNLEGYCESEWSSMSTLENSLKEIEVSLDQEYGNNYDDDDEINDENVEDNELYCIACEKLFKNIKGMENHMKSKKHKENVQLLKDLMTEEDDLLNSDENLSQSSMLSLNSNELSNLSNSNSCEELVSSPESILEKSESSKKKQKRKKRRNLVPASVDLLNNECLSDEVEDSATEVKHKLIDEENKNELENEIKHGLESKIDDTPVPKLKGKKAKEARKKMREQIKVPKVDGLEEEEEIRCATCKNEFPSRNKLFNHLKSTGHSLYLPSSSTHEVKEMNNRKSKQKHKR